MTLKENDIRPDELMKGQAERFENDIARMMSRQDEFVDASCPACGTDDAKPRFTKYGLRYVECSRCETMYITPRPSPEVLDYYYENSENYEYWNNFIFPASENVRMERIFRPRAQRLAQTIERFGVSRSMLLEVGSGFGTFAEAVRDINLFERIVAVEPTPDLAQTCREKGFEVIESPFEHVDQSQYNASVVTAFEVVEHLFSPRQFFEMCRNVLQPGGLVVVSCPNGQGFDVEMMQDKAGAVDAEHLNYFNPKSLALLVESCGFEVLDVSTPGELDVDLVRKKALSGEIRLDQDPFLERVLLKEHERLGAPFQKFLAQNCLSGHLVLVGRRPAG